MGKRGIFSRIRRGGSKLPATPEDTPVSDSAAAVSAKSGGVEKPLSKTDLLKQYRTADGKELDRKGMAELIEKRHTVDYWGTLKDKLDDGASQDNRSVISSATTVAEVSEKLAETRERYESELRQLRIERTNWRADKRELQRLRQQVEKGVTISTSAENGGDSSSADNPDTQMPQHEQILRSKALEMQLQLLKENYEKLLIQETKHDDDLEEYVGEILALKQDLRFAQNEANDLRIELNKTQTAFLSGDKELVSDTIGSQAEIKKLQEQVDNWQTIYFESMEQGSGRIDELERQVNELEIERQEEAQDAVEKLEDIQEKYNAQMRTNKEALQKLELELEVAKAAIQEKETRTNKEQSIANQEIANLQTRLKQEQAHADQELSSLRIQLKGAQHEQTQENPETQLRDLSSPEPVLALGSVGQNTSDDNVSSLKGQLERTQHALEVLQTQYAQDQAKAKSREKELQEELDRQHHTAQMAARIHNASKSRLETVTTQMEETQKRALFQRQASQKQHTEFLDKVQELESQLAEANKNFQQAQGELATQQQMVLLLKQEKEEGEQSTAKSKANAEQAGVLELASSFKEDEMAIAKYRLAGTDRKLRAIQEDSTKKSQLQIQMEELSAQINTISAERDAMLKAQEEIAGDDDKLVYLQTKWNEERMKNLEAEANLQALQKDLDETKAQIAKEARSVPLDESELTYAKKKISQLESRLITVQREKADALAKAKATDVSGEGGDDLDSLRAKIDEQAAYIEDLQMEVEEAKIASAMDVDSSRNAKISANQTDSAATKELEAKVESLQKQLESAKNSSFDLEISLIKMEEEQNQNVEEAHQEVLVLQKELEKVKGELENYQAEKSLQSVQEQPAMGGSEEQVAALQAKIEGLEKEMKYALASAVEATEKAKVLQLENEKLSASESELKDIKGELEAKHLEAIDEKTKDGSPDKSADQSEELEEERKKATEALALTSTLKEENDKLLASKADLETVHKELESKLLEAQKKIEEDGQLQSAKESELEDEKKKVAAAEALVITLTTSVQELETKNADLEMEKNSVLQAMQTQVEEFKSEVDLKKKEAESLQSKVKTSELSRDFIVGVEEKFKSMEAEKQQMLAATKAMQTAMDELQEELETASVGVLELEETKKRMAELEVTIVNLENDKQSALLEAKAQIDEFMAMIVSQKKEALNLQSKVQTTQISQEFIAGVERKFVEMEAEKQKLMAESSEMQKAMDELQVELETASVGVLELEGTRKKISQMEAKIAQLESDKESALMGAKAQIEELKSASVSVQEAQNTRQKIHHLEATVTELEHDKTNALLSARTKIDEFKDLVRAQRKEAITLQDKLQVSTVSKEFITAVEAQIRKSNDEKRQALWESQTLQAEVRDLQAQLERQQGSSPSAETAEGSLDLQTKMDSMRKDRDKYGKECKILEAKLDEAKASMERDALRRGEEISQLKQSISKAVTEKNKADQERTRLEGLLKDALEMIEEKSKEIGSLKGEVAATGRAKAGPLQRNFSEDDEVSTLGSGVGSDYVIGGLPKEKRPSSSNNNDKNPWSKFSTMVSDIEAEAQADLEQQEETISNERRTSEDRIRFDFTDKED